MKTFIKIVKARKLQLVNGLTPEESRRILLYLVTASLYYKLSGNIAMYNHSIKNYSYDF